MSTEATPPIPGSYKERADEIVRLREQLAELQTEQAAAPPPEAATDAPATATIGATAPVAAVDPNEPVQDLTHAIAPGSTGAEVEKLARTLEAAGEKTYLTDPTVQNYAHVFGDDLMEAVRRVLHDHPEIAAAEGAERQRLLRWINGLEVVTGEVWRLVGDVATTKAAPPA